MRFDEHFVKGALPDCTIMYNKFPQEISISIDSRTLNDGDVFFPLKGNNQDGHNFISDALKKGASGFFVAQDKKHILDSFNEKTLKDKFIAIVSDTHKTLIRLAMAWRSQFKYPVVAIAGSVGKTSTKELIATILKLEGVAFVSSQLNQNTQLGLAINMLRMRKDHKVGIFEVGINKRGEMAQLARMLRPTTAVITNIGHSHMEGLGSLSDIAVEKRDIFKYFTEDSIGVINGDQPLLAQVGYVHPVIKFGSKTINQIQARKINISKGQTTFILKIYKKKYNVVLPQAHEGAVFNVLAATAVCHLLGVSIETIFKAISKPISIPGRFQTCKLIKQPGILINDCYNANPESMKAALLAFEQVSCSGPKIAVLGDMKELGVNSPFWHRQLGRFLRKVPSLKYVILVGDLVEWTEKTIPVGISFERVKTWQEAIPLLQEKIKDDAAVLVKGSLSMNLKNLVKEFVQ